MTPDDERRVIDALLETPEIRTHEFKAAREKFSMDDAIDYCAAIANEHGGDLLLGVTNDRPPVVCGTNAFRDPRELERRVHETTGLNVTAHELHYDGHRVVRIQIPSRRRGEPVAHRGRFLMRRGESLLSMGAGDLAAIFAEVKTPEETVPAIADLTTADLFDALDVPAFFELIDERAPADRIEQAGRLHHHRLVEPIGRRWTVTKAGALFLARDLSYFPALALRRMRIIKYDGAGRVNSTMDQLETRGYGLAFDPLLAMVNAVLPAREDIEGGRRQTTPLYPARALREFVANAMVHQDLEEQSQQLVIEIFDDRLEIRNPGVPAIDVKRFVDDTNQRNPNLAEVMRLANMAEARGSGVDRALEQIESRMLRAPQFSTQAASTTVTLLGRLDIADMTDEEKIWTVFLHACLKHEQHERLTNTSLRARLGVPQNKTWLVSNLISATVDAGLIKPDPRAGASRKYAAYLPFFAL